MPSAKPENHKSKEKDTIRLNRYIAMSGVCSRREADVLIKDGKIIVNNKVVTEMGHQVNFDDKVKYDGKVLSAEKHSYILLNKPKDFITTVSDDRGRKTVIDLVKSAGPERIVPVGRLDKNTTGVLLFTNNGDLTKKLTHPSYQVQKLYHVTVHKDISDDDIKKLKNGFELEDGFIKADEISRVVQGDSNELGIELHSGKNRIVRRMMEHMGFRVIKLDRVMFANLTKKDLPRGKWRRLNSQEVTLLMRITEKK